jgi:hypothetical protein
VIEGESETGQGGVKENRPDARLNALDGTKNAHSSNDAWDVSIYMEPADSV